MQEILLHSCCAPCSSAIIEWMRANDLEPIIFYSNHNIYPETEYSTRRNEIERYSERLNLRFIEDQYDHDEWLQAMRGMEHEPERGNRCLMCFKFRLLRAAQKCVQLGIPQFTTTLASSRWKSLEQITTAGLWAAEQVGNKATFYEKNWRKGGLQERRNQLLKQENFYNQLYCGCEFSQRN